jgi:hypothetical protein
MSGLEAAATGMDYPPVSKERSGGVFNREIDMPTTPHNRLTRWPIPADDSRDCLRKFQDILDRQPPQYYGGPTDLMAALSAQLEAENRLQPVEPRLPGHEMIPSPCPYCERCKQSCARCCLVCFLAMMAIAAVAMWR